VQVDKPAGLCQPLLTAHRKDHRPYQIADQQQVATQLHWFISDVVMQVTRSSEVKSLLLVLVLMLGRGTRCKRRGAVFLPPDSTGLVGTPPAERPLLPLKFWANPRKSPLKPRRKDLDEPTLLKLMGQDFDSRWMRRSPPSHTHIQVWRRHFMSICVIKRRCLNCDIRSFEWTEELYYREWGFAGEDVVI
jgi:hypothetical protein